MCTAWCRWLVSSVDCTDILYIFRIMLHGICEKLSSFFQSLINLLVTKLARDRTGRISVLAVLGPIFSQYGPRAWLIRYMYGPRARLVRGYYWILIQTKPSSIYRHTPIFTYWALMKRHALLTICETPTCNIKTYAYFFGLFGREDPPGEILASEW